MDRHRKVLPGTLGPEVWVDVDYPILRFKDAEKAFKIEENRPTIFTFKKTLTEGREELQIHLRFKGRDFWHNKQDDIYLDVYVPWKVAVGLSGSLCTF